MVWKNQHQGYLLWLPISREKEADGILEHEEDNTHVTKKVLVLKQANEVSDKQRVKFPLLQSKFIIGVLEKGVHLSYVNDFKLFTKLLGV